MLRKIPKHISLILSETPTIILLEIPSSTTLKGTPEEAETLKSNELFEYLKNGDGRHRKTNTIAIQTLPILTKNRFTCAVNVDKKDGSTFASNWTMFDTFNANSEEVTGENLDIESLAKNERFFNAVLIIERLLANKNHNEQQKIFKGLSKVDLSTKVEYNYTMELLWTYANTYTKNRCVTGISFNKNEDIIAVSYGKYYFQDRYTNGAVMVWNMKNPVQPEREYFFHSPVTSLDFSRNNPNILAMGFYDGSLNIIDISQRKLNIVHSDSTSFEPIWHLKWYKEETSEVVLACFGDGKVCRYSPERKEIMRATKSEGGLKGIYTGRLLEGHFQTVSKYIPAKCFCIHPVEKGSYLLGTSDGTIRKCSVHRTDKESEFRAHFGTVNSIKYSPFAKKCYATCGDDFQVCFWMDNIDEPLITSRFSLKPVLDFDWSPSHSTILVSLRGEEILLWDLQRKILRPQSKIKSPNSAMNTICRFSPNGRTLLVGDVEGNVHVFLLKGLPFQAFFQEDLFFNAMKTLLITNEVLLNKIRKSRKSNK